MRLSPNMAMLLAPLLARGNEENRFGRDQRGLINLGSVLSIAGIIIGAVVAVILIAALIPTYLGGIADVVGVFNDNNTTTGDTTADSLLTVFGLLIAFAGLFAIVGLVFLAVRLKRSG